MLESVKKNIPLVQAKLLDYKNQIVLTVGSDAAIGKEKLQQ